MPFLNLNQLKTCLHSNEADWWFVYICKKTIDGLFLFETSDRWFVYIWKKCLMVCLHLKQLIDGLFTFETSDRWFVYIRNKWLMVCLLSQWTNLLFCLHSQYTTSCFVYICNKQTSCFVYIRNKQTSCFVYLCKKPINGLFTFLNERLASLQFYARHHMFVYICNIVNLFISPLFHIFVNRNLTQAHILVTRC